MGTTVMSETEEKDESERVKEASVKQTAKTFEIPSVFCNKVFLTMYPVFGRLTFGEEQDGELHPRAAVSLAVHDLLRLRDLIDQMLEGNIRTISSEDKDAPKK
jgi:hypothetical protein